ncbi:MAG: hypothetical protein ABL871_06140 [Terricaulis sp.]
MAGNAAAVCDVCFAMFAKEYLSIVSRWARHQLQTEAQSTADRRRLLQLIEAADGLSADMRLPAVGEAPEHVVRLSDHRKQRSPKRTAAEKMMQFLDT